MISFCIFCGPVRSSDQNRLTLVGQFHKVIRTEICFFLPAAVFFFKDQIFGRLWHFFQKHLTVLALLYKHRVSSIKSPFLRIGLDRVTRSHVNPPLQLSFVKILLKALQFSFRKHVPLSRSPKFWVKGIMTSLGYTA